MSKLNSFIVITLLLLVATATVFPLAPVASLNLNNPAEIAGKWNLEADAEGQALDLVVVLEQQGTEFSGTVSTPYGEGKVENGTVNDNDFSAKIKIDIQGMAMDLSFSGKVEGEKMTGTIVGDAIPVVTFSGSKVKS